MKHKHKNYKILSLPKISRLPRSLLLVCCTLLSRFSYAVATVQKSRSLARADFPLKITAMSVCGAQGELILPVLRRFA